VFNLTSLLPKCEDYGLTSQIRRSSASVSGNIAEAFGRNTKKEKTHFYVMARGSAYETESHLLYGTSVGYIQSEQTTSLIREYEEINHDINKIIKSFSLD
jgi:four helix bundle protein